MELSKGRFCLISHKNQLLKLLIKPCQLITGTISQQLPLSLPELQLVLLIIHSIIIQGQLSQLLAYLLILGLESSQPLLGFIYPLGQLPDFLIPVQEAAFSALLTAAGQGTAGAYKLPLKGNYPKSLVMPSGNSQTIVQIIYKKRPAQKELGYLLVARFY